MKLPIIAVLLGLLGAGAAAQTLYRCGNEYTQSPCPNGRAIDVPPPPTPAQQAEARRAAADEKRLGLEMERDRHAREAATRPAMASSLSAPPRSVAPAASVPHHIVRRRHLRAQRWDGDNDFVARVATTGRRGR